MNPLHRCPHLFTNGKFAMLDKNGDWHKITAYNASDGCLNSRWRTASTYKTIGVSIENAILIARPISDMTDEEVWQCAGFIEMGTLATESYKSNLVDDIKMEALNSNVMLSLLSIGVYPFDHSHFDDGTVIDINQI